MKAAGITLSTVGAGGGSNPFLEDLAEQGGGRFYDAANPASIPDIFLKETQQVSGQQIVEEPFFPILTSSSPILRGLDEGLPQLLRLQRHDGQAGGPDRARDRARRPAPRPVAVRPGAVGGVDVRLDRALGTRLGRLGRLLAVLQPARVVDVPGRGDRRHRGVVRLDAAAQTHAARRERRAGRLAARLLRHDARSSSGRTSSRRRSTSTRSRPGVYEAPLGELDPGAYAVRVTQTRPGSSPLGRTVGLVAPTAAEYRLLGRERAVPRRRCARRPAARASRRRSTRGSTTSTTTAAFTDLWPLLLVLALLLWPLDIALRRVSVGRREFAAAGAWVRGVPAAPARVGRAHGRRARACSRPASGRRRRASGRRSRGRTIRRRRRGGGAVRAGRRGSGGRVPAAARDRASTPPTAAPAAAGRARTSRCGRQRRAALPTAASRAGEARRARRHRGRADRRSDARPAATPTPAAQRDGPPARRRKRRAIGRATDVGDAIR